MTKKKSKPAKPAAQPTAKSAAKITKVAAPPAEGKKLGKVDLTISPVLTDGLKVTALPVNKILAKDNVRTADPKWPEKVATLADNIKAQGQLQPILVTELKSPGPKGEMYNLEFGFRRYYAIKTLKQPTIMGCVAPSMTELQALAVKLGENHGRADLAPMDEARAMQDMVDRGVSPSDIAKFLGVTEGYVSQRRALLKLPEPVQDAINEGKITTTHARELSRVKDPAKQEKLLGKAEDMNAQEFKDHVDGVLGTRREPREGKAQGKGKNAEAANKRVVRTADDVARVLKKASEAVKTAKDQGLNETQVSYIKGFAKGVMWRERPDVKAPV